MVGSIQQRLWRQLKEKKSRLVFLALCTGNICSYRHIIMFKKIKTRLEKVRGVL